MVFDYNSILENVFLYSVITSTSSSLSENLDALLELFNNTDKDEKVNSFVEILEKNTAVYCCCCIQHLTMFLHHHCESAEGQHKKCKHCSVMKHVYISVNHCSVFVKV